MTWLVAAWAFLKKAPLWLYGLAGAVLAVGWAFLRGRAAGRASERQKATKESLERKVETDRIEREVEGLPDDELDKRGKPWLRP